MSFSAANLSADEQQHSIPEEVLAVGELCRNVVYNIDEVKQALEPLGWQALEKKHLEMIARRIAVDYTISYLDNNLSRYDSVVQAGSSTDDPNELIYQIHVLNQLGSLSLTLSEVALNKVGYLVLERDAATLVIQWFANERGIFLGKHNPPCGIDVFGDFPALDQFLSEPDTTQGAFRVRYLIEDGRGIAFIVQRPPPEAMFVDLTGEDWLNPDYAPRYTIQFER